MTIRERIERLEHETLSPHAALSARSAGRARDEPQCDVRTVFQRDRDRIIHQCKAFRRLAHKTQVFINPRHDHVRTRLNHTLEVSQIARTIAKALRLNEALTEAVALGHDVGHTPFGHAGEAVLDDVYRRFDSQAGFHHADQSLRVVTVLENDGGGLNLCRETLDGIESHSKGRQDMGVVLAADRPRTLEARVVSVADRIAYLNHDIDDSLRADLITPDDIPGESRAVLGSRYSERISTMVRDVIEHSQDQPAIRMGDEVREATDHLKEFLYESLYDSPPMREERRRARMVLESLFRLYMDSEEPLRDAVGEVPTEMAARARLVCDHIAGMTDRFATEQYVAHFLPGAFQIVD